LAKEQPRQLAFEVRARHIVQQQIALEFEQLAQPLAQVFFQCLLVRQQLVERLVQPIRVDLLRRNAQELFQRRAPVPGVGDVQLTGRLAESSDREHRRHRAPGDRFAPRFDQRIEPCVEAQHSPQAPGQPDVAKVSGAFQANAAELDQ
jgi:hypothetical protein